MRYSSITMSELDATTVKWLTSSIEKDGKKKRREEQKAAQMVRGTGSGQVLHSKF